MVQTKGKLTDLLLESVGKQSTLIKSSANFDQKTLLDSISEYYPLLQLAIPQVVDASVEDWDSENEPWQYVSKGNTSNH